MVISLQKESSPRGLKPRFHANPTNGQWNRLQYEEVGNKVN